VIGVFLDALNEPTVPSLSSPGLGVGFTRANRLVFVVVVLVAVFC